MDPVLQFQPWLEFNRAMIRQGRLPLWNPYAGCGAPHLANGQSAVFDPFPLFAYLGTVPTALAWMAAARLWVAGLGMFLLASWWGFRGWGRWFAGLVYPFCGFLVVWLLYPVTPVAIWLPWLILASDRVLSGRIRGRSGSWPWWWGWSSWAATSRRAPTSCSPAAFALWRLLASAEMPRWQRRNGDRGLGHREPRSGCRWAAVQILPLGAYLAKSPVWGDRRRETRPWYEVSRPRCSTPLHGLALRVRQPAARASQPGQGARGPQPERVGRRLRGPGHAGLARPAGRTQPSPTPRGHVPGRARRGRGDGRVPAPSRGQPAPPPAVLDVTDNRRLMLWVAFGLTLLGAQGLDALARGDLPRRPWIGCWLARGDRPRHGRVRGALARTLPARSGRTALPRVGEVRIRRSTARCIGPAASDRSELPCEFLPRYYGLAACELFVLAGMGWVARRNPRGVAAGLSVPA